MLNLMCGLVRVTGRTHSVFRVIGKAATSILP